MTKLILFFTMLTLALTASTTFSSSYVNASDASPSLVVVELYTSQGCSSCPPADRVIAELATDYDDSVLPLSFHVDYWNYIGWNDPFSKKAFTQRQRAYSKSFGRNNVYTPQAVIGGSAEMIGSSRSKVFAEISRQQKQQADAPQITLSKTTNDIVVNIAAGEGNANILAIEFKPEHTTKILRGENRGRTLKNYNIVTNVRSIGTWDGTAQTISIKHPSSDGLAIVLQNKGMRSNTILSAARLRF